MKVTCVTGTKYCYSIVLAVTEEMYDQLQQGKSTAIKKLGKEIAVCLPSFEDGALTMNGSVFDLISHGAANYRIMQENPIVLDIAAPNATD